MVLLRTDSVELTRKDPEPSSRKEIEPLSMEDGEAEFLSFTPGSILKTIGTLEPGIQKHYYSDGNFNLMRLVFHLLKQTGPTDILMTTYSISQATLEAVIQRQNTGLIRSIRFIIDNRVKVMSPKPFQYMKENFNFRCISLHAKVALIGNENWKVSIVTSQNATDNPKLERGIIFTDPRIYDYDHQILEDAFNRGTD